MTSNVNVTRIANGLIYEFPDSKSCIPPHTHEGMSHYTFVLSGVFNISCRDGTLIAKPGDFIDFDCGENHCIQPLGQGAVFNRFHPPCDAQAVSVLLRGDLVNLDREMSRQRWKTAAYLIGGVTVGALIGSYLKRH